MTQSRCVEYLICLSFKLDELTSLLSLGLLWESLLHSVGSIFTRVSILLFLTQVQKSINENMTSGKIQLVFKTYQLLSSFLSLAPSLCPNSSTPRGNTRSPYILSSLSSDRKWSYTNVSGHHFTLTLSVLSQAFGHVQTTVPYREQFLHHSVLTICPLSWAASNQSSSKEDGNS